MLTGAGLREGLDRAVAFCGARWEALGHPPPAMAAPWVAALKAAGAPTAPTDAAQAAARHLLTWLVDEHGFSQREAYLTAGLCPEFRLRVYQMTAIEELRYVVGASVPRAAVER